MNKDPSIKTLDDAVPFFTEHVLRLIEEAVRVACASYAGDEYNDSWVFGTTLWRNLWNRVKAMAQSENNPFEIFEAGDTYDFCLGTLRLRHHRVNSKTLLPCNAVAAKSFADYNQLRFEGEGFGAPGFNNAVLAIVATPDEGLQEVFIGILGRNLNGGFTWIQRAPIMLPSATGSDAVEGATHEGELVPEEPEFDFELYRETETHERAEG